MNQNASIGEKIKALRTSQNLTLKQLSEKTNLSTGFLSQMERGMSSIAIDTLEKIAGVLGVSLSSFFSDDSPVNDISDPVMHSFALPATQVGPQIIQHILSHDVSSFDFLPRIFTLLPLANTEEETLEMYTHSGEEFIYILEGIATIQVESSQYTLYPGDSIQIHSNESHNWMNHTNKVVRLLTVNVPNPFRHTESGHIMPEDLSGVQSDYFQQLQTAADYPEY
nr:XRE family transcriptional regulator [uncultured Sellimonas sp.]